MATITLSPELSERGERAARERGTEGLALAESIIEQILALEEKEIIGAVTHSYDELKAGGGRSLEDFERDFDALLVARQATPRKRHRERCGGRSTPALRRASLVRSAG